MKILVRVKPNSKTEKVEKSGDTYMLYIREPAKENKANLAVINLLSVYFRLPKSRISILRGKKSRQKIVEIVNSTS